MSCRATFMAVQRDLQKAASFLREGKGAVA